MYNIKNILILILLTFGFSNQWINIRSDEPVKPEVSLIESSNENSIVSLELSGFSLNSVIVNDSEYFSVKFPLSASIMEEGYPDLPKYSSSIIVPDNKSMSVEILSSNFIDYENINIIPSKGNLSRLINPDDIPYIFDEVYKEDVFYPNNVVQLNEPYILRDYRGQVIEFHPVQYNPVAKVLRVYTSIEVKVFSTNDNLIINTWS